MCSDLRGSRMIRLVTFDAANTIIEHSWDPARLAIEAANDCDLKINEDVARQHYLEVYGLMRGEHEELEKGGESSAIQAFWKRCIATWLERQGIDPIYSREIVAYCQREVYSNESQMWNVFSDVLPTINTLRSRGIKAGIISNWDHSLHQVLKVLGLNDKFDFVIASLEFGFEKPAVEIFEEALRLSNENASVSLHVGDSWEDDVIGAKNAGFEWLHLDRNMPTDLNMKRVQSLCDLLEMVT